MKNILKVPLMFLCASPVFAATLEWASEPVTTISKGQEIVVGYNVSSDKDLKWKHVNLHICPIAEGPHCSKKVGRIDGPPMKGSIKAGETVYLTQTVIIPEDTPYGEYYMVGHGFLDKKNLFTEERILKYQE